VMWLSLSEVKNRYRCPLLVQMMNVGSHMSERVLTKVSLSIMSANSKILMSN
jgi:hypothetical protein